MSSDSPQDSNNVRNDSEDFRSVPQGSEDLRTVPQTSEAFRTLPNDAEARESHTLTVKEVARMFEDARVARTERSVINWCRKDAAGMSRLDSYFDPNERKHFITLASVERAIQEELAKAGARPGPSASLPSRPSPSEAEDTADVKGLRQKIIDLTITNKGKDYFIQRLEEDRTKLVEEQRLLVDRVAESNRMVGKLEEKLLRLEPPDRQTDTA